MNTENSILTILNEYWHILLAFIAFTVGYTKLHIKSEQNSKDNQETRDMLKTGDSANKVAIQEMEDRINRRRAEDLEHVYDTMNQVRIDITEVRKDIKTLLQRK